MKRSLSLIIIFSLLTSDLPRGVDSLSIPPPSINREITYSCIPPSALFWSHATSTPAFVYRMQAALLSGVFLAGTFFTASSVPLQGAPQKQGHKAPSQKSTQESAETSLTHYQNAANEFEKAVQTLVTAHQTASQTVLANDSVDNDIPETARQHLASVLVLSVLKDASVREDQLPDALRQARVAEMPLAQRSNELNELKKRVETFGFKSMKANRWKAFLASRENISLQIEKSRRAWSAESRDALVPHQSSTVYPGSVYRVLVTYAGNGKAEAKQYLAEGVPEAQGIRIGIARKVKRYDLLALTGTTSDTNPAPVLTSHTFAQETEAALFINHHSDGPPWDMDAEVRKLFPSDFPDSPAPLPLALSAAKTPLTVAAPEVKTAPVPKETAKPPKTPTPSSLDADNILLHRASARQLRTIFGEDIGDQNNLARAYTNGLRASFGDSLDGLTERKAGVVLDIAAHIAEASMRLSPELSHLAPVNRIRVSEAIKAAAEICKPLSDNQLDKAIGASTITQEDLLTFTKDERKPREGESALTADIRAIKNRIQGRLPRSMAASHIKGVIPFAAMIDVSALLPLTSHGSWAIIFAGFLLLFFTVFKRSFSSSASPTDAVHREASVFLGKDLLRYYLPHSWRELVAFSRLMNAPAAPLFEEFKSSPIASREFELSTLALMLNHNLLTYAMLRQAWPSMANENPEKAQVLGNILRVIQYNTLIHYDTGDAAKAPAHHVPLWTRVKTILIQSWRHVNRRTWPGRGAEIANLVAQWLAIPEHRSSDRVYEIHDWATGDGVVAKEMAEQLGASVRITALDKWMMYHIVDDQDPQWVLIYNDDGRLIQAVSKKDGRLWLRWTLACYFVTPICWALQKLIHYEGRIDIGGRQELIERSEAAFKQKRSTETRSISLLDPSAERYAQAHPHRLRFLKADLFDYPHNLVNEPRPDITLVQSLLHRMRPYFSDHTIRERLRALGETLPDGGALFVSVVGVLAKPYELYVDVFKRVGHRLERMPSFSKGYSSHDDWNIILLDLTNHLHPALRKLWLQFSSRSLNPSGSELRQQA